MCSIITFFFISIVIAVQYSNVYEKTSRRHWNRIQCDIVTMSNNNQQTCCLFAHNKIEDGKKNPTRLCNFKWILHSDRISYRKLFKNSTQDEVTFNHVQVACICRVSNVLSPSLSSLRVCDDTYTFDYKFFFFFSLSFISARLLYKHPKNK